MTGSWRHTGWPKRRVTASAPTATRCSSSDFTEDAAPREPVGSEDAGRKRAGACRAYKNRNYLLYLVLIGLAYGKRTVGNWSPHRFRESFGRNIFPTCNPFRRCDDRPADMIAPDIDFYFDLRHGQTF